MYGFLCFGNISAVARNLLCVASNSFSELQILLLISYIFVNVNQSSEV